MNQHLLLRLRRVVPGIIYLARAAFILKAFGHTAAKLELRPAGSWRVFFHSDVEIYGVYREVKPNTRLAFTWNSDNPQMNFGETLVTVDLAEASGSTEVFIHPRGIPGGTKPRTPFARVAELLR